MQRIAPAPADGEVEEFKLLHILEVAKLVRETTDFKTNCNLVIIDFLMRHGYGMVMGQNGHGYGMGTRHYC